MAMRYCLNLTFGYISLLRLTCKSDKAILACLYHAGIASVSRRCSETVGRGTGDRASVHMREGNSGWRLSSGPAKPYAPTRNGKRRLTI